ncbi:hypothetical protein ACIP6V_17065 [Streptomyces sp. NPDC088770]|uniref:hypothetical protein n=1 Tax=unclassified Streptomyces TaxID=2593676 RepID=UPI002DD7CBE3|nr:hypothetical protein [Streptomyces sp. NBC_01788]WSB30503.1 hypothetical protein OIE49_34165 [Streptomyces sp. NBC_01788]
MADSTHAIPAGTRRAGPRPGPVRVRRARGDTLVAAVAAVFTLAQLLLVRPAMGLGWDESIYVSQVSAHAPAAYFSAPRARGVSLLVAPVASWSSSTELLRVYLAVLSGLALYLALRVWRHMFGSGVLALAGALFASLWVTLFYGPQAMPNYWVAIGALACAGCFLRARADPRDHAALWGLSGGAALMALMRPMDAVWAVLPLLVLALLERHGKPLAALLAGLAAGSAEWVIEAFVSYGGLLQRLSDGSAIQGGLGWHFAVADQLRSLGGRALCRPCTGAQPNPAVTAWWYVLPLLALLGLVLAVRARRTPPTLIALACAATAAFPYLFLIGYAAPRFLLPAYVLLALPAADALVHLVRAPNGGWRRLAVSLVALGLAGHLAVQYAVLAHTVHRTTADRRVWSGTAATLHGLGVRPPCLLAGEEAIPIAFYTGCGSASTSGPNTNSTPAAIEQAARRLPVAALTTADGTPPAYARTWPSHRYGDLRLYVAPRGRESSGL